MVEHRSDPLQPLFDPRQEVRRLFRELVHQSWGGQTTSGTTGWQPCCDMVETTDAIVVEVELPGVRRKDVRVDVSDNMLRIAGERRGAARRQGHNYHYVERQYGRFERQLRLPSSVDRNAIHAKFSKGLLTVTLPKKPTDSASHEPERRQE